MPSRIQRQRTKGWTAPLCSCGCGKPAIYVGRPTKWGNPWHIGPDLTPFMAAWLYGECLAGRRAWPFSDPMPTKAEIRAELKGHDLMCWCPVKDPRYGNRVCCHADVLLKIANMEVPDEV